MRVVTVSVNLDMITDPVRIVTPPLGGATPMVVGNGPETAMCVRVVGYTKAKSGNTNNAKRGRQQRRRRSGR